VSTYPSTAAPRPSGSFMASLKVQAHVIGALLMRELHTRYGRENVGYLWLFLEPMMLAGAVASIHAGSGSHYGSDIRTVPFTICGYCTFILFRGIFSRAEGALESNMPLLYHRSITIFDILFSRAVLEFAGTMATFAILLSLATVLELSELPERPLALLGGVVMMLWFSFSAGMLCCAITHDNKLAARLVHPLTYIMMPLSGAFYQLAWIPQPYQTWLSWFPMPLIFEQIRYGQFRSASNTFVDIPYICAVCMIMTYLGLIAIKITRRHVHLN
jgi:capsular polysaccharide transport system permease protein